MDDIIDIIDGAKKKVYKKKIERTVADAGENYDLLLEKLEEIEDEYINRKRSPAGRDNVYTGLVFYTYIDAGVPAGAFNAAAFELPDVSVLTEILKAKYRKPEYPPEARERDAKAFEELTGLFDDIADTHAALTGCYIALYGALRAHFIKTGIEAMLEGIYGVLGCIKSAARSNPYYYRYALKSVAVARTAARIIENLNRGIAVSYPEAIGAAAAAAYILPVIGALGLKKSDAGSGGGGTETAGVTIADVMGDLEDLTVPRDLMKVRQIILSLTGVIEDKLMRAREVAKKLRINLRYPESGAESGMDLLYELDPLFSGPLRRFMETPAPAVVERPAVMIEYRIELFRLDGGYLPGEVLYTRPVMPGETAEIIKRTTVHSTEERRKAETIAETSSTGVVESIKKTLQKKRTEENKKENELNRLDVSKKKLDISVDVDVPVLPVSGGVEWESEDKTEVRNRTKKMVRNAAETLDRAVAENTVTRNSEVSTTVSDQTLSRTETEKTVTERVTFTNPNFGSVINVIYHRLITRKTLVPAITGARIVFSNSVRSESADPGNRMLILRKYLKPDRVAGADAMLRAMFTVTDHGGRDVDIDPDDFEGSISRYREMLMESGDDTDETLGRVIDGIPVRVRPLFNRTFGTIARVEIAGIVLDDFEIRRYNARVRIEEAKAGFEEYRTEAGGIAVQKLRQADVHDFGNLFMCVFAPMEKIVTVKFVGDLIKRGPNMMRLGS